MLTRGTTRQSCHALGKGLLGKLKNLRRTTSLQVGYMKRDIRRAENKNTQGIATSASPPPYWYILKTLDVLEKAHIQVTLDEFILLLLKQCKVFSDIPYEVRETINGLSSPELLFDLCELIFNSKMISFSSRTLSLTDKAREEIKKYKDPSFDEKHIIQLAKHVLSKKTL